MIKLIEPNNVGDMCHNENVKILLKDVDLTLERNIQLIDIIEQDLKRTNSRWINSRFPKCYCETLNKALRVDNIESFKKMLNVFLSNHILKHSVYHAMMYQELAIEINKLIEK